MTSFNQAFLCKCFCLWQVDILEYEFKDFHKNIFITPCFYLKYNFFKSKNFFLVLRIFSLGKKVFVLSFERF